MPARRFKVAAVLAAVAAPAVHAHLPALPQDRDLRPRSIAGRVVDRGGKPVAGAEVLLSWRRHPELPGLLGRGLGADAAGPGLGQQRCHSNEEGRFKIRPPLAGPFVLLARHQGHSSIRAFPVMAGDYRHLVLEPDHHVAGRVVDEAGKPVAGARVRLLPDGQTWSRLALYRVPERGGVATTDAEGGFRLFFGHGYLRQPFWGALMGLHVAGAGRVLPPRSREDIVRPTGASTDLRIVTVPSRPCRGRILDASTGRPVAGARILDAELPHLPGHRAQSGADGSFELPGAVSPTLHVLAAGHAPAAFTRSQKDGRYQTDLRIVLARGRRLRAQLVDRRGEPLARARVLLAEERQRQLPLEQVFRLDGTGRLSVATLPARGTVRGYVEVAGHFHRFLLATGSHRAIDLGQVVVGAGKTIRGQVRDGNRLPLSGARVELYPRDHAGKVMPRVTFTDHGGRFAFDLVADDAVVVVATAPGTGFASRQAGGAGLDAPFILELPTRGRGRRIAGVVQDRRGRPVAGAWVTLYRSRNVNAGVAKLEAAGPSPTMASVCVLAGDDGRFCFRGVTGSWTLITTFIQDGTRYRGMASGHAGGPEVVIRAADIAQ